MSTITASLRVRKCENDTERTVARLLSQSDGDWDAVAKATGISVKALQFWVRSLAPLSSLRSYL